MQFRKGVLHREVCGIARVYSGNERVDRVIEKLISEAAADERGEVLFAIGRSRGNEGFAQKPEFRTGGEERRHEECLRRHWERDWLPILHDEALLCRGIGVDA